MIYFRALSLKKSKKGRVKREENLIDTYKEDNKGLRSSTKPLAGLLIQLFRRITVNLHLGLMDTVTQIPSMVAVSMVTRCLPITSIQFGGAIIQNVRKFIHGLNSFMIDLR